MGKKTTAARVRPSAPKGQKLGLRERYQPPGVQLGPRERWNGATSKKSAGKSAGKE